MNKDFIAALDTLEEEKNINKEEVISAIENSIVASFKRNYNPESDVEVVLDRETGEITVYEKKEIVDEVEDIFTQISLKKARKQDPNYEVGDIYKTELKPKEFGRIAAQNAKQLILQKIKEAEKRVIYDNYAQHIGEMESATIEESKDEDIIVSLGNADALLPENEQVKGEVYRRGDRIKVCITSVKQTKRISQIRVSRANPDLIKRLFESEIPEINDGATRFGLKNR